VYGLTRIVGIRPDRGQTPDRTAARPGRRRDACPPPRQATISSAKIRPMSPPAIAQETVLNRPVARCPSPAPPARTETEAGQADSQPGPRPAPFWPSLTAAHLPRHHRMRGVGQAHACHPAWATGPLALCHRAQCPCRTGRAACDGRLMSTRFRYAPGLANVGHFGGSQFRGYAGRGTLVCTGSGSC
jgi:hypothetical protein